MSFPKGTNAPDLVEFSERTLELMSLLGHVGSEGNLREEGRDKLAQVLAFLPLVKKAVIRTSKKKPMSILECACGKGHLSLLMNQILSESLDRDIHWIGVDSSRELVEKCRSIADQMDLRNVEFHRSRIADYLPELPVTVLLGLHACDTATDEALVKGLELEARYIFLVPCCQREVARQLSKARDPALLAMRGNYTHRKQLGALLTDSLRRLVLEGFGYKVDVFEYVSVRRTEKNVMIRGESGMKQQGKKSWALYRDTVNRLGLRLTLDHLLDEKGLTMSSTAD